MNEENHQNAETVTTQDGLNRHERRKKESMERRGKVEAEEPEAFGDEGWNDLRRLNLECHALFVQPSRVLPLLRDQSLLEKVDDIHGLLEKAKILNNDIGQFRTRLEEISRKHQNRSGSSESPDDLMECLAIGEEYQAWIADYQNVVQPLITDILKHLDIENEMSGPLEGEVLPPDENR